MIQKNIEEGALDWLNNLWWHDSLLYEIRLIRRNFADQVVLIMDLIQDYEADAFQPIELTFQDCWLVRSEMHWGVQCDSEGEQIDNAISNEDGALVAEVKAVLPHLASTRLAEFHLLMASTGSTLDLVFASVSARKIEKQEIRTKAGEDRTTDCA